MEGTLKQLARLVMMTWTLCAAVRPAQAWNAVTHEELSRQSTLYMLRSSTPELRLVGATITQAGEGLKAGVSLQRRWPLAKEARDVDLYREVAVRNMNATPVLAPVMYYFDTYGFAAFNHFLLYGNQKKVTSFHDDHPGYAMAYDSSLTDFLSQLLLAVSSDEAEAFCSDAAAGAVESAVIRVLTFGDGPLAKTLNPLGVAVGWIAGKIAGSMAAGLCPKLAADYDFSPVLAKKLYTNNHSTATRADFHGRLLKDLRWHPVDNLGSAGASLFRQSSNALDYDLLINNRTNLLSPQVHPITLCYEDSIACAQQTNTSYSALAQSLCPSGRCASMDPTLFKRCSYRKNPLSYYFDQGGAAGLYAVIARRCKDGSEAACRLLDGKPIHSCPAPFSVNGRVLLRCLDRGSDLYLSLSATPKDAAESFSEELPYQAGDRYQCKVAKGFRLPPFVPRRCANQGCYEYYTDFWRYTKDQWPEACTVDTQPRPFQRAPETCMSELVAILAKAGGTRQGVLLHLGRLIHAASDAAQPGHVTGELNGTEHTAMEGYAEQNVAYNFAGHQEQEIEVQDHVVTVPAYKKDLTSTGTVNARYALSYLVDPQEADFWISQWKEEYIDQQDSTEHILEAVAKAALDRVKHHKDAKTVFFVADPAQAQNLKEQATKVTRDYLTLALVGNVIAMTRAMQMHFGAKWSSMVSKVSWTAADEDLPAKAGTPVALDMPLADMLRSYGVSSSTFSPYVEYAYQEKTFHDVCYISTHNWCTSHRGMGRPCVLPDCRKVACTAGTDCPPCQWHYQARSFEPPGNALPFVGPVVRVTLSRHNKGKGDDYKVHITGAASEHMMDVSYRTLGISQSAGQQVLLPKGVRAAATWCTGPDIWTDEELVQTGGTTAWENTVVCQADIDALPPRGAPTCDTTERCLFSGGVVRPDGSCRPWNEEPANWNKDWTKLIDPGEFVPFGTADEVFAALQTLASGAGGAAFQSAIRQLAAYYDVRPWVLESALVPALGKPVTVVDSSPMGGVASFIWSQDPDRVAIVTALERGGLVSWLGDPRAIDGHRLRP